MANAKPIARGNINGGGVQPTNQRGIRFGIQ